MRSRLLLSCLLFIFIMACRQRQGDEMNDPSQAVKIEDVTATPVVFSDSIKPPIVIKAGVPMVVTARQPSGTAYSHDTFHVHEVLADLGGKLASLSPCRPKGNGSPSIQKVHIEPRITDMGVPEAVIAKDMDSKEVNPGNFSYFNSLHGLPTSVVRDVLVDRHGHLWIATTGGVCRYDGKTMSTYTKKQGLLSNDITTLFEDRNGHIWFASYNGSISRFDGKLLTQYQCNEFLIRCMTQDTKGNIWMGTKEGGIYYFDGSDFYFIGKQQGFYPDMINTIIEKDDGNIWIGTEDGVFIYDGQNINSTGVSKPCGAMTIDKKGEIWLSIENEVYHSNDSGYVKWNTDCRLFQSQINQLFFDSFDHLWVSTMDSGVALFDGKSLSMFNKRHGLPGVTIEKIVQDKSGAIWIGYMEGLCRHGGNVFTHYLQKFGFDLGGRRAVYFDTKDRMWISSFDIGGLSCIAGNEVYHYRQPQGLNFPNTTTITEDQNGTIWFASWGRGLCAYDGKTFSTYSRKQGLLTDSIWSIAADAKGNIWCATRLGISRLESDRSAFTNYTPVSGFDEEYRPITAGKDNDVWAPGNGKGLFHFQAGQEMKITRYGQIALDAESILIDHNEFIWLGGYENGLVCFDGKRSYHFTPDGFGVQNSFVSSVEDTQGNLWFATFASGLFKLDYKRFEAWKMKADSFFTAENPWQPLDYSSLFIRYGSEEGFMATTVIARTAARDREGNLWFSAKDRITRVNIAHQLVDTVAPMMNVTAVKLFNERVDWMAVKNGTQRTVADNIDLGQINFDSTTCLFNLPVNLRLPFSDNNLNFEYNVINLAGGKNIIYQYKLDGLDNTWSSPTTNTEVNYGNMSPGHYTFKVKGKNGYGNWSDISEFSFLIRPPWWRTWWAYLLYAFSAGAVFYFLRRYDLHRQYLKHNLELEKVEANKLKELDVVKSRLYTNITHEFRTPLTVILGMAEQIEKKPEQPVHERIDLIRRNGRQLLSLVNQMLDLSKIESQQMQIYEIQSDMITYLRYIVESFHSMAYAKDIQLNVIHPPGPIMMDYDPVRILQIISNLLSNAIKFTPPGGEIKLAINQQDDHLNIEVSDTGIGIEADQVPFIFSRFYQADSSSTRQGEGTGIGLTLTQELVKLLGGTITVESQMNKGTTFFVELPVKKTAPIETNHQISELDSLPFIQTNGTAVENGNGNGQQIVNGTLPLLLVIEDNADVATYLVSCLEDHYQVVTAVNGQLGIDKALEIIPDIIITDVMMPLKDGFEVCDTLKKDTRTSHIPIIILTAKATVEDRIAGLERGADVYLAKPFHQDELIVQLRNLITTRQKLQERYRHLEVQLAHASPDEKIEDAFLLKFRGLIEAELDNADLSIDDICRKLMMSRTQIHRKITALTDRSTSLFIRSIRLQHAKRMLQSTDLNVSEVAYRVGFDDPKYFSRVFQEEFQVAPSEAKGIQS